MGCIAVYGKTVHRLVGELAGYTSTGARNISAMTQKCTSVFVCMGCNDLLLPIDPVRFSI